MDKYKFDEYKITEKSREYSVIVFPKVEYMWAFDDYPEENCYMVDGTAYAFKLLKLACVILISAPNKIIYFPCKQEGIGCCYRENYHFVMCSPQVQLRRSNWVQIRRKISKSTWVGKYKLCYDRKKLDDYCIKQYMEWYKPVCSSWRYELKTEVSKFIRKTHVEEVLGDTLFMVLSKEECYHNHYLIAKDLDEYGDLQDYGAWTAFGWMITKSGIENMKKRKEEEAVKKAKQKEEFPECVFI